MTIKEKIKLFVPPILFRIKGKLKHGGPIFWESIPDKDAIVGYLNCLNDRFTIPMQDIDRLSTEISGISSISREDRIVNFYGSLYTLQKYAQIPFVNLPPIGLTVQHGITYELLNCEMHQKELVNLLWSKYIVEMHKNVTNNHNLYAIGAPFFYAESILNKEEILAEKRRLGHNLLAFPMHSTANIEKNYNPQKFLSILESEKKKFENVRVCLYWRDIQRGTAQIYRDAGYECVCCGHIYDQAFLMRQKALFEIADATISNAIGSHVGYSVFTKTPHNLVPDKFELKDIYLEEGAEEMEMVRTSQNYKEIYDAFCNNYDYQITDKHCEIVDKYWGVSDMKTPSELRRLIMQFY